MCILDQGEGAGLLLDCEFDWEGLPWVVCCPT